MALTYKTTRARIAQLTEAVKDYTLLGMSPKGVPTEVYLSSILNYIPDISSEIANYISSDDLTELDAADNLSNNIAPSQRAVVSYVKTSGGINNAIVGCPGATITGSSASTEELEISLNDKDTSLRDTLSYEDFNKYRDSTLRLITESQIAPSADDQDLPYWGGFSGYMQQRQLHQGDIIKLPLYVTGYGVGYYWVVITEPIQRITNTSTWSVVGRVINSQTDGGSAFSLESAKKISVREIYASQIGTVIPTDAGLSRREYNLLRNKSITYRLSIDYSAFNSVEENDLIYHDYRILDNSFGGAIYGTIYYSVAGKVTAETPSSTIYYLFVRVVLAVSDGNEGNLDPIFDADLCDVGATPFYQPNPALAYPVSIGSGSSIESVTWRDVFPDVEGPYNMIDITEFNILQSPVGIPRYDSGSSTWITEGTYKAFTIASSGDEYDEIRGVISSKDRMNLTFNVKAPWYNVQCELTIMPYGLLDYTYIPEGQSNPVTDDNRKRVLFTPLSTEWTYRV